MPNLLTFTDRGIYCAAGDFYIDPWRAVDRALITHGHADHARANMQRYLATEAAAPVIRYRLGDDITLATTPYGTPIKIGDATVSFHPAGHVPGSAQIRVEVGGEVWVVSGDYKVTPDGLSEPFEPVACHAFITECTFGLPVFNWLPQVDVIADINAWWQTNRAAGKTSAIGAYALGKAQRILANIDTSIGPVLTHAAIESTNEVLRAQGIALPETVRLTADLDRKAHPGALIIATPSALNSNWPRGFGPVSTAFASGWMALRGVRRRRSVDRGFVLSDHADWPGLNDAIKATGAERIFVTHGYTAVFRRWLEEQGFQAEIVETEYEGESAEAVADDAAATSDDNEDGALMKRFAALFTALDQTTKTTAKVDALAAYFGDAPEPDRLWTMALLSGRRPRRGVTTTLLRQWAAEHAGLPLWLFEESYAIVGDLAETIAVILPGATGSSDHSLTHWINVTKSFAVLDETDKRDQVIAAWDQLPATERFVFNKLITGGFRMGVSQKLMTRALARATGIDEAELSHRLMGDWTPDTITYESLIHAYDPAADLSKPYPFYLAYQLDDEPSDLGPPVEWSAEHKWDGIRGQLIVRGGNHFLWSRGEELITNRFPELEPTRDFLPDGTVIDGELLAWNHTDEAPLPFNDLQKRIGRKTVPKKLLAEAPVVLRAYDLLEHAGDDFRTKPFAERRAALEALIAACPAQANLRLSPIIAFETWDTLAEIREGSRAMHAEGVMLKRRDSPYLAGRKRGDWWKWKIDPLTIDAVMIYAQQGSGRRANLFTDFTFAVWDGAELVPFTKAYSGLTDAEFREITTWVRRNTLARFGPVRQVTPEHVFEIAFEGIQESSRHKSGIALRFPRMARWRHDKPKEEAGTLADLKALLAHGDMAD